MGSMTRAMESGNILLYHYRTFHQSLQCASSKILDFCVVLSEGLFLLHILYTIRVLVAPDGLGYFPSCCSTGILLTEASIVKHISPSSSTALDETQPHIPSRGLLVRAISSLCMVGTVKGEQGIVRLLDRCGCS
jgi:hypothetical protein